MRKLVTSQDVQGLKNLERYLENHNIKCQLNNVHQAQTPGVPSFWFPADAELWIEQDYLYDEAQRLVKKFAEGRKENHEKARLEWECEVCGEKNPGTYEFCWKCKDEA